MMKLEDGDYFETNFKNEIRSFIPLYEEIWGKFIGHDGNGRMIELPALSEESRINREKFAQHFYTCIESIIGMHVIETNTSASDLTHPIKYMELVNNIIAFQAHSGRIRDNVKKMLEIYYSKEYVNSLLQKLEELYQERNTVLHGKKLPLLIEDDILMIAPPSGNEEDRSKWRSEMNWSQFARENYIFVEDYMKTTLKIITSAYNDIISNIKNEIYCEIKKYDIVIERNTTIDVEITRHVGFQAPLSGSNNI